MEFCGAVGIESMGLSTNAIANQPGRMHLSPGFLIPEGTPSSSDFCFGGINVEGGVASRAVGDPAASGWRSVAARPMNFLIQ